MTPARAVFDFPAPGDGDPNEIVRARAVAALAVLEGAGPEIGGMLAEAARDPSAFVRRTVARVLAIPALPRARALLAQMAAEDPASEVRRAAEEATRQLGGDPT